MSLTTSFYQMHVEAGAKIVEFAGYKMPLQYQLGIKKEHLHTRTQAGLFDISHMGQIQLIGKNAKQALERLMPIDVIDLPVMKQRYGLLTNKNGGIIDDLMVINIDDDSLLLVVNAACKKTDFKHLKGLIGNDCELKNVEDRAFLALQGPMASKVLARLAPESSKMPFMSAKLLMIDKVKCLVTRSGYSGEDGFEISFASEKAKQLAKLFLADEAVEWVGIGARNSLRLEAGLSLYGNELDKEHSPVESSLSWALSKARRFGSIRPGGYLGDDVIMNHIAKGTTTKIVGLLVDSLVLVRDGTLIIDYQGNKIGIVTSGGFAPSIKKAIAIARVKVNFADIGTNLFAVVRDKKVMLKVVKMPFVKVNYFRA